MSSSHFLTNTINTYYEEHGNGKSYPLIFIHPIRGNVLIWHHEISVFCDGLNNLLLSIGVAEIIVGRVGVEPTTPAMSRLLDGKIIIIL
jgi:hypothetical protein